MIDLDKELEADNLTQKDIMKFLLHSTQHAATREELQEVKKELKIEMLDMKNELKQDISGLRSELKNDMTSLKTELKKDILGLRSELKNDMTSLKTELKKDISNLRSELKNDMTSLKTELKKDIAKIDAKFDRIQWLIIATIASVLLKDYILDFLQK